MAEEAVFAGPALRRLRRREGLTQAAMATQLGISPSYLNLIERNQRPLTARVMVQIVERFDFDPRSLREAESVGGVDGLARRLADQRFSELAIDRDEMAEILAVAPHFASAFAQLYDAAGQGGGVGGGQDPLEIARREIERWRNHFADLDSAAEEVADELRLSRADIGAALTERLRERHQIALRILPSDVMPDHVRRLDLHARQLQLSEMLDPASRNFQIATQLAQLEQRETIRTLAAGADPANEQARNLFEHHLYAYFAAALIMPYGRFLRACDATGYDFPVLMRRFGVSFEQLAHRLTTLQRVGQRGLPFFMARVDRAGQLSKRFAGASGATFLESETTCPLWHVHRAFERAGEWCIQDIALYGTEGHDHWLTISRLSDGVGAEGEAQFAVVVGLEARFAGELAAARGLALRRDRAQVIGPGCRVCHAPECRQRSLPPRNAQLAFDTHQRGVTAYRFNNPG
ncbi:short-chain fatty acyl-CoA regulator family protein [Pelagerythrobacter marensis]|uniref:Short-chain fatty acyl-CoA regulator family protein n=1 Tax=Pelagerythrobacter marensis TaxID=543877 RepID=A0ABZ2D5L7_9SPHN